ncbi:thioredoxin family protein, partial [Escherichia coli]|uniref:thioredoxin family protein n=1 Tax=Escherichia coli TaxID=562 RepID=UPI00385425F7
SWTTQAEARAISWQPFAPEKIDDMVRSGRTVFVDIGASWCVTCKVNEMLVIDGAAIRQRLISDVVPIKGDWTTSNE